MGVVERADQAPLDLAEVDAGLKAFNASPEVLIAAPTDGETVSAAVAVTLRGVVSDPDGPLDGLEASWRS